jgi:WD40 repeat protein
MKRIVVFLLVSGVVLAQMESPKSPGLDPDSLDRELWFELISLTAKAYNEGHFIKFDTFHNSLAEFVELLSPRTLSSHPIGQASPPAGSVSLTYSPVYPVVAPLYSYFSSAAVRYSALSRPGSAADLTGVQPTIQSDPQMIFLDGFGNSLIAFDLTTQTTAGQVVVPSTTGPFGIRPSAQGASNEVWVLSSGFEVSGGVNEVTVVNLGTQSVVTNIAIPSTQAGTPVGIAFTNDGATAFEAVKYQSADLAGNNGALVVFDAANRAVTSTMLLKSIPYAVVMAPDGSTLYLLATTQSTGGTVTYYDVLSGTAGFTATIKGNYNPNAPVFIHPDGTRLFWNVNYLLEVFDLKTRQVTSFTSGLPSTAGPTMRMSQDGARVYFTDPAGDIVVVDTSSGVILSTSNTGFPTSVFAGPPIAP